MEKMTIMEVEVEMAQDGVQPIFWTDTLAMVAQNILWIKKDNWIDDGKTRTRICYKGDVYLSKTPYEQVIKLWKECVE